MEDKRQLAREKRLKKKKKRKIGGIVFLLMVLTLFIFLYVKFSTAATTQVVYQGTAETVFRAKGIAVFEEELISSQAKGVAVINYSDGTRVLSKTHIATIYTGDIEESKSSEIKQLNEKINYLETNIKNYYDNGKDSGITESVIADKLKKVTKYSICGNLETALSEASELKSVISSNSENNIEARLKELKSQRDDAERSISGKKEEYISKTAGAVYSSTDGYETTISPETVKDADVKTFQTLWNSKPADYEKTTDNYIYGKIINNYEVNILSQTETKNIEGIEEGSTIYIRLSAGGDKKIPATVKKIEQDGKKALITLCVTKNTTDFLADRKFEFEFIKATHNGLKVPKEAIKNENGEDFVYIIKEGVVRKCKVEILYEGDDVIVKEDNSGSNALLLYDLVIVKSKNISEGMIIGY